MVLIASTIIVSAQSENASNIKVGGWLKINSVYDFVGIGNESALNISAIPTGDVEKDPVFTMDLYQTRLFFDSNVLTTKYGNIQAYVEVDFYGNNGGELRMRHAYVKMGNWTLGQAWSAVCNLEAWPNITDFDGPATGAWVRQAVLRYKMDLGNKHRLALALEAPFGDYDRFLPTDSLLTTTNQNMPDFLIRYTKDWTNLHFQATSIFRQLSYRSLTEREITYGYGGVVSLVHNSPRWKFITQGIAGVGISRYLVSFQGGGWDAAPKPDGSLDPIPVIGGYASAQYYWNSTKTLSSTAVVGLFKIENRVRTDFYDYSGEYYSANLYYQPIPALMLGAEYIRGHINDENNKTGMADRVQLSLEYSF
ncbi:DcaP family trimeric outer membrane transporter [Draconibacterium aestuarii]